MKTSDLIDNVIDNNKWLLFTLKGCTTFQNFRKTITYFKLYYNGCFKCWKPLALGE